MSTLNTLKHSTIALAVAMALTACGGGGGGGAPTASTVGSCTGSETLVNGVCTVPAAPTTPTPPVVVAPVVVAPVVDPVVVVQPAPAPVVAAVAPTLSLQISQSKVSAGTPVTVTWTTTDATSCTGMDNLSGTKSANSSEVVTPIAGGRYTFTVSCDGAGGNAKQSVALVVPFATFKSSYENAKGRNLSRIAFPASIMANSWGGSPLAWGEADFFQTGEIDIFTANQNYSSQSLATVTGVAQYQSDFQFWTRNPTTGALTLKASYKGCLHPRKALVADFNNDGYADVFVACHGFDASPWPGEKSKLLLSDGNGGFTISDFGDSDSFYHAATAADINGDGYPDIVVADAFHPYDGNVNNHGLRAFINNKNGTFTRDMTRFSATIDGTPSTSVELVDVNGDGVYDLIAGGAEVSNFGTTQTAIYYGDSSGTIGATKTVIPPVAGRGTVLDFTVIKVNGNTIVYVGRTADGTDTIGSYMARTLQKYVINTNSTSTLLDAIVAGGQWIAWWEPVTQNGQTGVAPYSINDPALFLQ